MKSTSIYPRIWAVLAVGLLWMSGCGDLKRENPLAGGLTLREQLVGSWSRDEAAANEIFIFKVDGSVERRSYSSPAGGAVDRNQSFPTTRVRIFAGTYTLVGNLMTLFYTRAQSNDPADNLQLPSGDTVIEIAIQRSTLTLTLTDGKLFYARLN
jgi:hypothetical protein